MIIKNYFYMCHPAVVLLYFVGSVTLTMISSGPILTFLCFFCAVLCRAYAKGAGALASSLKISLPIIIVLSAVNPLVNTGGLTVIFSVFGKPFTLEALIYGVSSGFSLSAVIIWFALFNDVSAVDGVLVLFSRFTPTLVRTVWLILRFIPDLIRDSRDADNCYYAACRDENTRKNRLKAALRTSTVVFEKSLEDSIETAKSMNARGFACRKSKNPPVPISSSDKKYLALTAVLLILSITATALTGRYVFYPICEMPSLTVVCSAAVGIFMLLPIFSDLKDEIICLLSR